MFEPLKFCCICIIEEVYKKRNQINMCIHKDANVCISSFIIIIPRFVRLCEEIIHLLKLVDYLPYRRTNRFNYSILPHHVIMSQLSDIADFSAQYSRLSLSRNRRDPQKHFEISVLRHIRFVVLRKNNLNNQILQTTM